MGQRDASGLHKSKSRIRVVHAGKIYDVTDFAQRHPGGWEVLQKYDGQDVEAAMQNSESHVHSKAAYSILEKYCVGTVDSPREENGNYKDVPDTIKRHEDYYKNDIVDWSKPILRQVGLLGDKYFDWTHQQVDRPIRLFESDFMEMMSKANWWFVPVTWVPVVLYNLWASFMSLSQTPEIWPSNALGQSWGALSVPFLFTMGLLFWTLLEYVIHRWLFHLKPPTNWPALVTLHFSLHGQHHKSPMDPMRLVFPPLPAACFAALFYLGCSFIFPHGMVGSVFAGILSGYMAYDLLHYYVHHGGKPFLAYIQRLKTYHTRHHYEHQQLGFGISSKMWDYPFGTLIPEDDEVKKLK